MREPLTGDAYWVLLERTARRVDAWTGWKKGERSARKMLEINILMEGDRVIVGGRLGVITGFALDDPVVPWIKFDDDGMSWDARDLRHDIRLVPKVGVHPYTTHRTYTGRDCAMCGKSEEEQ